MLNQKIIIYKAKYPFNQSYNYTCLALHGLNHPNHSNTLFWSSVLQSVLSSHPIHRLFHILDISCTKTIVDGYWDISATLGSSLMVVVTPGKR